jgi:hypothetical protein
MMKCLSAFLFLFMGTIVFAQENFSLPFANAAVIADGDPHDWTTPLKHYDINTRLFFDFKNDSNNLYLCFQTNDIATQTKLLRAGMKITLSSKINGKHKATIGFPLAANVPKSASNDNASAAESQFSHKKSQAILMSGDTLMELKGFISADGIVASSNKNGISAAIKSDDNDMFTYEAVIPLKELLGDHFEIKDVSKEILLSATINAMKKPASDNRRGDNGFSEEGEGGRMGGGRQGGMGRGGRMGGNGGGNYSMDRSALYDKSELKQKLSLAIHP